MLILVFKIILTIIINIIKNKRDILDKIYYVDEFGIEYWHGEPIESKEATKEEQEEMEKMLESFKEMEEDINW